MPCPLCAADSRRSLSYERHKLESCPSCGLVYPYTGNPRGAASVIEEIYDAALVAMREKYGQLTFMNHAVFNSLLLEMVGPAKELLEVGSGTGEFLYMARCGGWEVVGIEPSSASCAYASAKYGLPLNRSLWNRSLPRAAALIRPSRLGMCLNISIGRLRFCSKRHRCWRWFAATVFSVPNRLSLMNLLHGIRSPLYAEVDHLCHFDLANVLQLAAAAGLGIRMLFTRQYVHGFEDFLAAHPVSPVCPPNKEWA